MTEAEHHVFVDLPSAAHANPPCSQPLLSRHVLHTYFHESPPMETLTDLAARVVRHSYPDGLMISVKAWMLGEARALLHRIPTDDEWAHLTRTYQRAFNAYQHAAPGSTRWDDATGAWLKPTREEFIDLLAQQFPTVRAMIDAAPHDISSREALYRVCRGLAVDAFVHSHHDSQALDALRGQLQHIEQTGSFDFAS